MVNLKHYDPTSASYPALFEDIANTLSKDVVAYLIGGENLRVKGLKNKTKDCDLVVTNSSSYEGLVEALENLGYTFSTKNELLGLGQGIEPSIFLKHQTRIPVHIFTTTVAKRLYLSHAMKQRAKYEMFNGRHRLTLGILQNEDVFLLKSVTVRQDDTEDLCAIAKTRDFNWNIVWQEMEEQDKDTGNVVLLAILDNIDYLLRQGSNPVPIHKKLLAKTIDERICIAIRNKPWFKDELISAMTGNGVTEAVVKTRLNRLLRIRLIKEHELKNGRVVLRATKANVLKYRGLDTFYDQQHLIGDFNSCKRKRTKHNQIIP